LEIFVETESGAQLLKVTKNLYEALHHLRDETRPRVLWIDAICINQRNLPERSSQVRRMADIYSLSKRVVVWLGPEAEDSSLALELLGSLATKVEINWETLNIRPARGDLSEQHWGDQQQPPPYNDQ
jgi:Heterokaryon incompatibility protein (HET)